MESSIMMDAWLKMVSIDWLVCIFYKEMLKFPYWEWSFQRMSIPIAFIINLREADSEDTINSLNSVLKLDDIKHFNVTFHI